MTPRVRSRLAVVAILALALTGCLATQENVVAAGEPAGFLFGLWHGFVAPLGFIVGLFSDARVYAVPNTGLWYDLGFMLGLGGFSGGIFASSKTRRR